jgi:UrcA family protein
MKISASATVSALSTLLLTAAFSPSPAQADENSRVGFERRSMVVNVGDLDLLNPVDAQTLLDRVHGAASELCELIASGRRQVLRFETEDCVANSYRKTLTTIKIEHGVDVATVAANGVQRPVFADR